MGYGVPRFCRPDFWRGDRRQDVRSLAAFRMNARHLLSLKFGRQGGIGFRTGQVGVAVLKPLQLFVMISKPPASSEEFSSPLQQDPTLDDCVKDPMELDLWELDDLVEADLEAQAVLPKVAIPVIPAPRVNRIKKSSENLLAFSSQASENVENIRVNIARKLPKVQMIGALIGETNRVADFEDLDRWNDLPENPPRVHGIPGQSAAATSTSLDSVAALISPEAPPLDKLPESVQASARGSGYLRLDLSILEKLGLAVLVILLVGGGGLIFFKTLYFSPTATARMKTHDFPIKGRYLSIESADSYWREPITEGKNAEITRRGTQLLPVVNFRTRSGTAAVRVFFRNSDGEMVGDAVIRLLHAGSSLAVAATAGFEDIGMYAAYRTGQSEPWSVEVYEAATENSPVQDFKKLFEIKISTDRR